MFKQIISISLVFLFTLTLFVSNIFACACCAERGHYSISTSKPSQYVLNTLKDIKLTSANLYTDASYPEGIKGINPLGDNFSVINNNFAGNIWNIELKDNTSKSGKLDLLKPISMVEYMVDPEPNDEETPNVTLYKEWRFKYKVNNATGIFQHGFDKKNVYFLVLQGKGNLCTDPETFKNYRLEITGRNSNFMFFGSVNKEDGSSLKLGALKGDYSGCSCSAQTDSEMKRSGQWKTFNFYEDLESSDRGAYFNIDGKDIKFPLIKKGKEPDRLFVGYKRTDVYQLDGITINVEYVLNELPCEECEGTNYDVTITAKKGDETITEKGKGSCGC